jgi:hypothetical protein
MDFHRKTHQPFPPEYMKKSFYLSRPPRKGDVLFYFSIHRISGCVQKNQLAGRFSKKAFAFPAGQEAKNPKKNRRKLGERQERLDCIFPSRFFLEEDKGICCTVIPLMTS